MKNIKNISLLLVASSVALWSCSKTTVINKSVQDDMYATSAEVAALGPKVAQTVGDYSPEYLQNYNDEYDRAPEALGEGTDEYYNEEYLSARNLDRNRIGDAGYNSSYDQGYAAGWNDRVWSSPMVYNSWRNNAFAWNNFGFNSFGFNRFASPWAFNSFGFNPYGLNSFGWGSPFGGSFAMIGFGYGGWNSFNSFGFNNWGFDPWGLDPWGYNSFGFGGFNRGFGGFYSPYYGVQPVFASTTIDNGVGVRSYGPLAGSRSNSTAYNGNFVNTRRQSGSINSSRVASTRSTGSDSRMIASRANGGSGSYTRPGAAGASSRATSGTNIARRPASYDAYTRNAGSYNRGSSTRGTSMAPSRAANTGYSRSAGNSTYSRGSSNSMGSGTYTRPSSGSYSRGSSTSPSTRSYTPSTSRSSGSYSSPSRSSSGGSYSSGSSRASSSSSSSSSSRSSGSSSRGPR